MDEQIFFLINGAHNAYWDQYMWLVSDKMVWVPLYVALLYAVWRNYSWRGMLMMLAMVGIGMLFTDSLNANFIRPWIGRLRPCDPDNPISPLVHLVNNKRAVSFGCPSAHSANIWLLTYLILHWFRERWTAIAMVVVALLVCYSRLYLGQHYPVDILGGFILARLVVAVLDWAHNRYFDFEPNEELRHTWVPAVTAALTIVAFAVIATFKC